MNNCDEIRKRLEELRRQQETLERALSGPFEELRRRQETLERALSGPFEELRRQQETLERREQNWTCQALT